MNRGMTCILHNSPGRRYAPSVADCGHYSLALDSPGRHHLCGTTWCFRDGSGYPSLGYWISKAANPMGRTPALPPSRRDTPTLELAWWSTRPEALRLTPVSAAATLPVHVREPRCYLHYRLWPQRSVRWHHAWRGAQYPS